MGATEVQNGTAQRQRRRWHFGNAIFDETAWTLTVAGQPVALEPKPLELLRALLERAGEVVGKNELLEAVWPGVVVVEASLPTAIRKLRRALGDENSARPIIATVARIGYRLTVPVRLEHPDKSVGVVAAAPQAFAASAKASADRRRGLALAGAALLGVAAIGAVQVAGGGDAADAPPFALAPVDQRDARLALRQMDVKALEAMIVAGWDPETPFDDQQNGALNILLERCEWDPGHDRQRLLLAARLLVDNGTSLTKRNIWGDTAYSIAKAPRYCGASHPVTVMLRRLCTSGDGMVLTDCEADYAGAKRRRAALASAKTGS